MDNIWVKVIKQYPDIETVLDNLYKQQLSLLDAINELETNYPVEGYEWECNPNNIGMDMNPWFLVSKQKQEEVIKRTDERLKRQINCVEGKHEFQSVGSIRWCKYCGTIEDTRISSINGEVICTYYHPECPHFLPKKQVVYY